MKSLEKDINDGGGAGMSRAAKKRAKKKKKQSSTNVMPEAKRLVPENGNGAKAPSNKKQKRVEDRNNKNKNEVVSSSLRNFDKSSCSTLPTDLPLSEILLMKDCKDKDVLKKLKCMTITQRASFLFEAILAPITLEDFYNNYFEKKPLLISSESAGNKYRYKGLLSLESIVAITKKHTMYYGRDLNVTKYRKGEDGIKRRVTLDKLADDDDQENGTFGRGIRVENSELWSNYKSGCTIRLLCPHKYNDSIQSLLSMLEIEWGCMAGANAYLTPKSSQGFSPHYDDIDAFCLQLQGSKRWKVYNPIMKLPRTSSEDFTSEDLEGMKPALDVTLNEGDLLYMPRGWIHEACTLKDQNQHSLHLTISTMQQWAWVDLMEIAMPEALNAAAKNEDSTSLREGLPQGFMDYMGVMYEDLKDDKIPDSLKVCVDEARVGNNKQNLRALLKENFKAEAKKRIMEVAETACEMLDATCDEMAKRYLSERQPPALTANEVALVSQGDVTADEKSILPNTKCRLIRPGIGRLVIDDDKAVVYHCVDNSREYHQTPISPMEFEMDDAAALEQLITTVEPDWIFVNDLFHDSIEDKIQIVQALYDEGIIALKEYGKDENEHEAVAE